VDLTHLGRQKTVNKENIEKKDTYRNPARQLFWKNGLAGKKCAGTNVEPEEKKAIVEREKI